MFQLQSGRHFEEFERESPFALSLPLFMRNNSLPLPNRTIKMSYICFKIMYQRHSTPLALGFPGIQIVAPLYFFRQLMSMNMDDIRALYRAGCSQNQTRFKILFS